MNESVITPQQARHLRITDPSPWIARFTPLIPANAQVLDLACGGGRHTRLMLDLGHNVTAVDKNTDAITQKLGGHATLEIIQADLEDNGDPFGENGPLAGRQFNAVMVVNYLHRDLMAALLGALKPGGVFLYETFARGNEVYARPRNPDHLLRAGELLDLVGSSLQIVAYEHGLDESTELPGVKQRIAAVNDLGPSKREDGEPNPHPLNR